MLAGASSHNPRNPYYRTAASKLRDLGFRIIVFRAIEFRVSCCRVRGFRVLGGLGVKGFRGSCVQPFRGLGLRGFSFFFSFFFFFFFFFFGV